jgi:hypothetical protein
VRRLAPAACRQLLRRVRCNDGFRHAHEPGTKAVCSDALRADARALKEKVQFVREHFRFAQSGGSGQLDELHSLRRLVFLDDATGRVAFFRELDRGIGERAAALVGAGDVIRHFPEPATELRKLIAGMKLPEPVPASIRAFSGVPQIFRNQLVLGREVPIERHLVGAGGLGDRVDPDSPDSMPVEQIPGDRENAFAWRNSLVFFAA